MSSKIFRTLSILGIVATWSEQVMRDGRITIAEVLYLAQSLSEVLDIPIDIDQQTLFQAKEMDKGGGPLSGGDDERPEKPVKPEE